MKSLTILLCALPLGAQTLTLSGATAGKGSAAKLVLSLASPPGRAAVALQWEIVYPSPQLTIEDSDLRASASAGKAHKTLSCAGKAEGAGSYVYRCILAGGAGPIPNGPAAALRFAIRKTARRGTATVRIRNALGADADGNRVDFPAAQADIAIR